MGSNRNRWDLEKMQKYCDDVNNGYKVLDVKWVKKSYQNQQWALVKCKNDNHPAYWSWWNKLKSGHLCKLCDYESKGKIKWTPMKAAEFFQERGYTPIDINEYKNVDKTVWCYDSYGFKVRASITNLRSGGFPSPFQYNDCALENIRLYCELFRPDYEILSETYDKIKTKYLWKYNGYGLPEEINPTFQQTADSFINGGCGHPFFFKSNGNKIFENELIKNNIEYIKEKKFKGCKDKRSLRFDFYIPKLHEVIEIDGLQHTTMINYFGGENGYKDRIRKDNIKNEYCKNNNIQITRIPYETNKLEKFKKLVDDKMEILVEELSKYNNTPCTHSDIAI